MWVSRAGVVGGDDDSDDVAARRKVEFDVPGKDAPVRAAIIAALKSSVRVDNQGRDKQLILFSWEHLVLHRLR